MKLLLTLPIIVEVTEDDLQHGTPQDFFECPINLAFKRAFEVSASIDAYHLRIPSLNLLFPLSEDAKQYRESIDEGCIVEPKTLTLVDEFSVESTIT